MLWHFHSMPKHVSLTGGDTLLRCRGIDPSSNDFVVLIGWWLISAPPRTIQKAHSKPKISTSFFHQSFINLPSYSLWIKSYTMAVWRGNWRIEQFLHLPSVPDALCCISGPEKFLLETFHTSIIDRSLTLSAVLICWLEFPTLCM